MPLPGRNPKILSRYAVFGPPALAERAHERVLLGNRRLHDAIDVVVQIVVGTG